MQTQARTQYFRVGIVIALILSFAYLGSYLALRSRQQEIWAQNNHAYVIFQKNQLVLYYAYRPLTYLDAQLTGMRFHIGPHQDPE